MMPRIGLTAEKILDTAAAIADAGRARRRDPHSSCRKSPRSVAIALQAHRWARRDPYRADAARPRRSQSPTAAGDRSASRRHRPAAARPRLLAIRRDRPGLYAASLRPPPPGNRESAAATTCCSARCSRSLPATASKATTRSTPPADYAPSFTASSRSTRQADFASSSTFGNPSTACSPAFPATSPRAKSADQDQALRGWPRLQLAGVHQAVRVGEALNSACGASVRFQPALSST